MTKDELTNILNKLPEVVWDRWTGEMDDEFEVFGWIDREDEHEDFVLLEFDKAGLREISTSSARFSNSFSERLLPSEFHAPCRRVEDLQLEGVKCVKLGHGDSGGQAINNI